MSGTPRVTIHMPTHNQGRFIAHALEGALNQTYADYDVVVSENHSTDDTAAVLARYRDHPRLRVVRPPAFLSANDNFKFCVAQSDSEYFSYLCSDDGLYPDFLAEQVALLDRYPTASFAHSAAHIIDEQGRRLHTEKSVRKTGLTKGSEAFKRFIFNARCVGDSVLFRRASFDRVGGFGDLYALDWEVELLLCTVGDVAYNQNVLMQYRNWEGPDRTVRNQLALLRSIREFYDRYEPRFPTHRARFRRARVRRALGAVEVLVGMNAEQREIAIREIRSISRNPWVETKLRAFAWGLGPRLVSMRHLVVHLKREIKKVLYPVLTRPR